MSHDSYSVYILNTVILYIYACLFNIWLSLVSRPGYEAIYIWPHVALVSPVYTYTELQLLWPGSVYAYTLVSPGVLSLTSHMHAYTYM